MWKHASSFTSKRFILFLAALVFLFAPVSVEPAHAQSQSQWAEQVGAFLQAVAEGIAIPDAIAPIVTIAQNADKLALAALDIAIGRREREILTQQGLARNPTLTKQLNALQRLKAQKRAIERKINPPHREQGDDPFFAVLQAGGPISLPSVGSSVTVTLNLDLSATDPDLQPATYLVLPPALGAELATTQPIGLTVAVNIINDGDPSSFRLELLSLSVIDPSADLAAR